MLKPKSPQESFYGNYLYDRIVPIDHLLRKINQVVDFSFIRELVKDKYTPLADQPKTRNSCSGYVYFNTSTVIPIDRL